MAKTSDVTRRMAGDLDFLSPIEHIIEDARNGKMFILVDDKNRENEGDLVIPGALVVSAKATLGWSVGLFSMLGSVVGFFILMILAFLG